MKRARSAALVAAALLVLGTTGAMAANPGNPATATATASVNILDPLLVSQNQAFGFGKVVGPLTPGSSNDYNIGVDGSMRVTGTGGGSAVSGHSLGLYTVSGTPSSPVRVSGALGSCSAPAIGWVTAGVSPGSGTLSTPTGLLSFRFFGAIRITNPTSGSAATGVHSCSFNVTVQYE